MISLCRLLSCLACLTVTAAWAAPALKPDKNAKTDKPASKTDKTDKAPDKNAKAADPAADKLKPRDLTREIKQVREAMADGLFDVAALRAGRLLALVDASPPDHAKAAGLLVESLVRAGKGAEALTALKGTAIPDQPFWEGQAALIVGDYDRAAEVLGHYPPKGPLAALATIACAHAYLGEGREVAARKLVKPLRASTDPEIARHARLFFDELELGADGSQVVLDRMASETVGKDADVQFLRARAMLDLKVPAKSEAILRDLLNSGNLSERQHDAATVLLADTLWRERSPDARPWLLAFINGFSASIAADRQDTDFWGEAFSVLERLTSPNKPDGKLDEALLTPALAWAADSTLPERQGYSLFFIAEQLHKAGRDGQAIGYLESLIQLQPTHPRCSEAVRLAMQLYGAQRSDPRVIELAELWRRNFGGGGESVVDFLAGTIRFSRGEYHEALSLFARAADLESDLLRRRRALYNACMCAIRAGEKSVLTSLMAQLTQASTTAGADKKGESPADVQLDHALQLAAQVEPAAGEELASFLKQNPNHPRWAEAEVALAEFSLLDVPPRTKPAAEALAAASTAKHDAALQERMDYVNIWLHEAMQDLPAVTRSGLAFMEAWPNSTRLDEVRMKVGEAYYRQDNFLYARTQFELLVKNNRDSPYADTALFFAGKAAMSLGTVEGLNAAISTWDDLAQREGPLAISARQHQAIAKRRQGNNEEALKLLSDLLLDRQAQGDLRYGIMCDKAELLVSMGRKNPKRFEEAVALLRGMLEDKALPFAWSARVGVLLGQSLKDQKRNTEALEACYNVVTAGSNFLSQPTSPGEYHWYYRAGFLAVALLEESQQWEPAARMAERLAQTTGDRAKEAAEKASQIRLKHFLWDARK